jgi:hypothetical protein
MPPTKEQEAPSFVSEVSGLKALQALLDKKLTLRKLDITLFNELFLASSFD